MTADPFRVLVTGSRDWDDEDTIWDALEPYLPSRGSLIDTVVLVHGDCPTGADHIASLLWTANGGLEEPHPADWKTYGKGAGFYRNSEMVDLGADVCLAFWKNGSRGTQDTMTKAHDAGIPVRVWKA